MHDVIKSTSAFLAGVAVIALAYGTALSTPSLAEKTVMVGGAEMFPRRTSSRTPSTRRITPRSSPR